MKKNVGITINPIFSDWEKDKLLLPIALLCHSVSALYQKNAAKYYFE
jgi:hypothetical protein